MDLVRSLGAEHVIDYTRADFADGTERDDLILDIGGNSSLSKLRRALTPTGTVAAAQRSHRERLGDPVHRPHTYPLSEAGEAMRHLEAGNVRGKVVITI